MACVESNKLDSEMEEGEIVDDVDELSDISSEEEYLLLRKRLQVLEKYNNVLERTKAKRSSIGSGTKSSIEHQTPVVSKFSSTELQETCVRFKNNKHVKTHHKPKKRKEAETNNNVGKYKDKRKVHRNKRKLDVKVISESSEESEDEYKNKRWKLANAVNVNKQSSDKSSLSARLKKMLSKADDQDLTKSIKDNQFLDDKILDTPVCQMSPVSNDPIISSVLHEEASKESTSNNPGVTELIDVSDDDVKIIENKDSTEVIDPISLNHDATNSNKNSEKDSDEDLELLRQYALKTKATKQKTENVFNNMQETKMLSEDEDSDTAELRLICLKSALLKKAIERKQKQKLKKRLSQSSNLQDELMHEQNMLLNHIDSDNNTDIESVDMEIGSDGDDKSKEVQDYLKEQLASTEVNDNKVKDNFDLNVPKEDELDEDEDLLRAKLLTSLSKNMPNLLTPIENTDEEINSVKSPAPSVKLNEVPQKRFIINVGESDSEGEHEATRNLTKMHMKLSNQNDFQERLDTFLKSTRMEVEQTKVPDIVQEPTPKKFVAKAVNHLPKSEQIEYKNLVRRMAELEKIKLTRQSMINISNKAVGVKDTLKPRNIAVDSNLYPTNNLEDQIALSRKKIAEESAKILKLKEEGTKLSQKYKIVATELWNITTAITFNKKQQRAIQNNLTKIRLHHQSLLKSSTITKHSVISGHVPHLNQINKISSNRLQKENNPTKDDFKNQLVLKNIKVSVANDYRNESNPINRLCAQLNHTSKTIIKGPKTSTKEKTLDLENRKEVEVTNTKNCASSSIDVINSDASRQVPENASENNLANQKAEFMDDYRSPLEALGSTNWEADPNAILCPFEVGGDCKDPDCKYLHTNVPTKP